MSLGCQALLDSLRYQICLILVVFFLSRSNDLGLFGRLGFFRFLLEKNRTFKQIWLITFFMKKSQVATTVVFVAFLIREQTSTSYGDARCKQHKTASHWFLFPYGE